TRYMLAHRLSYNLDKGVGTYNIRQESVRNKKRNSKENRMLKSLLEKFLRRHRCLIELFLVVVIAFYPVLYFPKYHFQEDGLRTDPAAEHPSENNRK